MKSLEQKDIPNVTKRLKALGYANHREVRMYGEHLELTSDPSPEPDGFSIEAKARNSDRKRRVKIPQPVVQMAKQQDRLAKAG